MDIGVILSCLPCNLAQAIKKVNTEKLEEIRIRCERPVILKTENNEIIIDYKVDKTEIMSIIQLFCNNSIYAYQNQICEGFITILGGHRIGISGTCVIKEGKVININNIYSLNIRIAREINNASIDLLKYILDTQNNSIYNTLIVSPPGAGKTTILRDLVSKISNGIPNIGFKGINVTVIDERSEISAMYRGIPQNNIGIRTDVLDNIPKIIGIKMAIRTLAPKVIVADEIGNLNDAEIINYAICSGVKGIFTAHGDSMEDLYNNPELQKLIKLQIFQNYIFLDSENKGSIKNIIKK